MSRFNTRSHQAKPSVATVTSPMGTSSKRAADTRTFGGGAGWKKDAKTDLFLRATASFHDGGNTFYESGEKRDQVLLDLAAEVAVENPAWFYEFVLWLRRTANIRTAAIMVAAAGVKAQLDAGYEGAPGVASKRAVIDAVLYRADEPGELLAFWMSMYGRKIPKPVKRGVADAVRRLYNQRSLLKYDTASHGMRFGDVLNLVHPTPAEKIVTVREVVTLETVFEECPHPEKRRFAVPESAPSVGMDGVALYTYACRCGWYHSSGRPAAPFDKNGPQEKAVTRYERVPVSNRQGDLFQYALDRRFGNVVGIPESLHVLHSNFALREDPRVELWLDSERLNKAGMTWEDALSAVGSKVDKGKLWEALIPSMGYMALLRNLRNFDEAGVSNKVASQIIAKLVDEGEVAKSRQLPFRFYSAYLNAPSLRWAHALETALDLCLPNIPEFSGRTLVLVDTSSSMRNRMSGKSSMSCVQAAALFGAAVATKSPESVDLYHFATGVQGIPVAKGGSVLKLTEQIQRLIGQVGHGTEMAQAISATYRQHDRVVLFSDMQAFGGYFVFGVAAAVPAHVPVYAFNLAGYSASPMPTGAAARFDLGGLTDQTFKLIPLLEAGQGAWPWETSGS